MKSTFFKKYIGDRRFYGRMLAVAVPIIIQNGITNFVNMLDNIMVGRIGTEQMSGVAIINQLIFVFNLALFGAVSGPGIFTAQYVGSQNHEGIRNTVRYKLYISVIIAAAGIAIMWIFREPLALLFMTEADSGLDLAATLTYSMDYLRVMLIGLVPFASVQAYGGTLRESGRTVVPMVAGLIAVFINLFFNYILIFGHLGLPALGVTGAAIATVLSRFIEAAIIIIWTHTHTESVPFAKGLYSSLRIPKELTFSIIKKGTPLFFNEFLWSMGMSAVTQCYSTRGLDVIAAFNISNTIVNLFNVMMISMGSVVAIIVGQILGSGETEEAVDADRKLIAFSIFASAVLGLILAAAAPLFPKFYNTTDAIRAEAVVLMRIAAAFLPVSAFLNTAYFTIRSGGKTFITFLFDSVFLCVISWPAAMILSRLTSLPIAPMYTIVLGLDFIKVIIGYILIKKRIWINNIVA